MREPFKAIVYLFLNGGADSWNMLVPYGGCQALVNEYNEVRGDVAMPRTALRFWCTSRAMARAANS